MELSAVSADSHVNEPPDLFITRVTATLRDRAPHCVDLENGGQAWVIEDVPEPMPLGLRSRSPGSIPKPEQVASTRTRSSPG